MMAKCKHCGTLELIVVSDWSFIVEYVEGFCPRCYLAENTIHYKPQGGWSACGTTLGRPTFDPDMVTCHVCKEDMKHES